ncbi:hypothetical protein BCAMP_11655 [Brochothrix campestris FSL F6-1037]|uniref:Ribosomal silencing factor RsfS n=1 Tax=Brochothrix campestris FSL F6-1037 TaxID=1265861 RepID=W7C7P6_9LIST|nr:hypothetical protein BCAMP_11655 [Brochothrix campestris FSL F6-1037]
MINSKEVLMFATKACDDKRAEEIIALDMTAMGSMTDYIIICHGNSEKQVKAIATEVKDQAHEHGIDVGRIEGISASRWVLVDLGDVVVHVFHSEDREYYNLEKLWGDAPTMDVSAAFA